MTHHLHSGLKCWLDAALGFLYPPVCQICQEERAAASEGYVCASCWSRDGNIRFIKPPFCERCGLPYEGDITTQFECGNCRDLDLAFSRARSAVVATRFMLDIVHRYKYQRALCFEPFLADLLVRQAGGLLREEKWDMLVPVPLHPVKRREREFNQAERLAIALGRAARLPVNPRLLQRVEPTRTQTQLSREKRADNVRRAFSLRTGERLKGTRIVLIDDVFTTGATTNACAGALRRAGAAEVCVWTVMRGT